MCYITKAQSYWGHRDHSSGCCQTTNPHYSWPSAAKMELISETLKRSLKLHRIKWTDKDRGCKTLCISHHSLTLAWVCLGLSEHSLTEKVSYWLMIFLSLSGIFICVQSCASISTLALAQQCPHDFAEPFQTSGSSILWCVLAEQTLHTVSLTSRKKDQWEVEIFYWSSRSLCAFLVHLFCTCACSCSTLIPCFCSAIKHTAPVKCLPCIIHSYCQGELWLSNPRQYEQHVVLWADQASASTLQSYILFCVLYIQATIKYLITAWIILISYCVNS